MPTIDARDSGDPDAFEQVLARGRRDDGTGQDWVGDPRARGLDRSQAEALLRDNEALREQVEQLQEALRSSREIGMAVGLLMARRDVGREEAFRLLSDASQRSNVKLRDLARRLVNAMGRSA